MVFTISCSDGADGKDGRDGVMGCHVEENDDGTYEVFCGNTDLGQFVGGEPGAAGAQGANGANGKGGNYCLLNSAASVLTVSCGSDGNLSPAITLDGCTNPPSDNDKEVVIQCGDITKGGTSVSLCDGKAFNPANNYCTFTGDIISNSDRALAQKGYCGKSKKVYFTDREYCGYTSEANWLKDSLSVMKQCLSEEDLRYVVTATNYTNLSALTATHPGGGTATIGDSLSLRITQSATTTTGLPITVYIRKYKGAGFRETTGALTEIKAGDIVIASSPYRKPNEEDAGSYVYKYCAYPYPKSKGLYKDQVKCGDQKFGAVYVKPNDGGFRGEYCGFKTATSNFSELITEKNGGKAMLSCPVVAGAHGSTKASGGSEPSRNPTAAGDSASAENGMGLYLNGTSPIVVDDSLYIGPNEKAFGAGYCATSRTGVVHYSELLCDDLKGPNNGKWNGEYCGYKNESDYFNTPATGAAYNSDPKHRPKTKVITGICDDNGTPNYPVWGTHYCQYDKEKKYTVLSSEWCGGKTNTVKDGKTVNALKWNNEYCAVTSSATAAEIKYAVKSDMCDDGGKPSGESKDAGYCQFNSGDTTSLVSASTLCAGKRINEKNADQKTWPGQYCGWKNEESGDNDTLYTGACDDGQGPNTDGYGTGYCKAGRNGKTALSKEFCGENGKPNEGSWKGEYCGYESADASEADKVLTGACDDSRGPNSDKFEGAYCQVESENDTLTVTTPNFCGGSGKLNEGKWKGEYCAADDKVAACTGGLTPNTSINSTEPAEARCIFTTSNGEYACNAAHPWLCTEEECATKFAEEEAEYVWDGYCKVKSEASKKKAKLALKK